MRTIKIHNATTGEVIEREMTAEELEQFDKDSAEAAAQAAERAALQAEAEAAKAAAQAKLAALGLTTDDLKALGL